jgi:hypothetical protein
MANVTKHATTHRSKGLGGSDHVPPDLPFIRGIVLSQSVTTAAEAQWTSVDTTDPDTFRYDPDDDAGLLMQRNGTYQFLATLKVSGGSASAEREIFVTTGVMSGGPFGGSPVVDTPNIFTSGYRLITADSDDGDFTTVLWENSIRDLSGTDVFDPFRAALVLGHSGFNYNAEATLMVIKLANQIGVSPPPLPEIEP